MAIDKRILVRLRANQMGGPKYVSSSLGFVYVSYGGFGGRNKFVLKVSFDKFYQTVSNVKMQLLIVQKY